MSRIPDHADAVKLLARIEHLEAEMNRLGAPIAAAHDRDDVPTEEQLGAEFRAVLDRYTVLMDRMQASPLWPNTVEGLRAIVAWGARTELPIATSDYYSESAHA